MARQTGPAEKHHVVQAETHTGRGVVVHRVEAQLRRHFHRLCFLFDGTLLHFRSVEMTKKKTSVGSSLLSDRNQSGRLESLVDFRYLQPDWSTLECLPEQLPHAHPAAVRLALGCDGLLCQTSQEVKEPLGLNALLSDESQEDIGTVGASQDIFKKSLVFCLVSFCQS